MFADGPLRLLCTTNMSGRLDPPPAAAIMPPAKPVAARPKHHSGQPRSRGSLRRASLMARPPRRVRRAWLGHALNGHARPVGGSPGAVTTPLDPPVRPARRPEEGVKLGERHGSSSARLGRGPGGNSFVRVECPGPSYITRPSRCTRGRVDGVRAVSRFRYDGADYRPASAPSDPG